MRLADKVAVITGGAAGIGFQYAKRFLAEGARVVVADVVDPLAAAEKLGAADRVLGVRTDVSIAASVGAMVAAAVATFGRIDVLVNNAASSPHSSRSPSRRSRRRNGTASWPST